jgi:hypothetical protein
VRRAAAALHDILWHDNLQRPVPAGAVEGHQGVARGLTHVLISARYLFMASTLTVRVTGAAA